MDARPLGVSGCAQAAEAVAGGGDQRRPRIEADVGLCRNKGVRAEAPVLQCIMHHL